jgi:ATP-binding cassette subfamily B protein
MEIGKDQMSLGSISLYLGALFQLSSHLKKTANDGVEMLEVWRMGKDFAVLLTAKPDLPLKKNKPLPHVDNPLSVRFENVSFRYPHRDECVLKDVSFTIHPGECVAFVGENGAGKSTIVKLICRFYDVTQGRILINGIDIREIDIDQLRNAISVVFQQFGQYGLTLAENVAIGDLRKRDKIEEIKRVIRQVDMEEEVARLQKGYRQIMGREWNGTDLSGGQWQRIAIARAFMRDSKAKLLIFDEPSSALDDYTEYEIIQSLKQLGQNKTVIFVTHHLANAKLADHILLLDQGRVIEQGDHHTLIGKKGIYMEWVNLYQEMKEGKKLSSAN